jgi:hypothetical protein
VKPERWREVEAIFLAARDRQASTRSAFLDEACSTDPTLRQEVESLLKADSGASGFMEPPEVELGLPNLLDRLQAALGPAYGVERELGGGGMSRIFVATETALDRRVVIKVLPPELAAEVDAERFHRESRLAASLRHPQRQGARPVPARTPAQRQPSPSASARESFSYQSPVSSRLSHARVTRHCRFTVAGETPSTSAVSSMLSPAK